MSSSVCSCARPIPPPPPLFDLPPPPDPSLVIHQLLLLDHQHDNSSSDGIGQQRDAEAFMGQLGLWPGCPLSLWARLQSPDDLLYPCLAVLLLCAFLASTGAAIGLRLTAARSRRRRGSEWRATNTRTSLVRDGGGKRAKGSASVCVPGSVPSSSSCCSSSSCSAAGGCSPQRGGAGVCPAAMIPFSGRSSTETVASASCCSPPGRMAAAVVQQQKGTAAAPNWMFLQPTAGGGNDRAGHQQNGHGPTAMKAMAAGRRPNSTTGTKRRTPLTAAAACRLPCSPSAASMIIPAALPHGSRPVVALRLPRHFSNSEGPFAWRTAENAGANQLFHQQEPLQHYYGGSGSSEQMYEELAEQQQQQHFCQEDGGGGEEDEDELGDAEPPPYLKRAAAVVQQQHKRLPPPASRPPPPPADFCYCNGTNSANSSSCSPPQQHQQHSTANTSSTGDGELELLEQQRSQQQANNAGGGQQQQQQQQSMSAGGRTAESGYGSGHWSGGAIWRGQHKRDTPPYSPPVREVGPIPISAAESPSDVHCQQQHEDHRANMTYV